jgi:ketosteroid isomerase-like protein
MTRFLLVSILTAVAPLTAFTQAPEAAVRKALDTYDQAIGKKDVETVRNMLAPDVLLYEHSVRNDGARDAFENHLKPEILEGNLQLTFSDVRITSGTDLALVTRQYRIQGSSEGRAIDATGNETLVWKKLNGQWKIFHIHYSHACPKSPAPK